MCSSRKSGQLGWGGAAASRQQGMICGGMKEKRGRAAGNTKGFKRISKGCGRIESRCERKCRHRIGKGDREDCERKVYGRADFIQREQPRDVRTMNPMRKTTKMKG